MLHAPDPAVPLVESIGALADLRREGKVRQVGASNLGRRQLAQAWVIVDIVAVENNLSPARPAALPLARTCAEAKIAFLAWSPLGGQVGATTLGRTTPSLAAIARERSVSAHQVALAWGLAQASNVIPIPSARRPETILDSVRAWDLKLTAEELAAIDADYATSADLANDAREVTILSVTPTSASELWPAARSAAP